MTSLNAQPVPCYVLQQIERHDSLTKIEQISVHKDIQYAINKFVTIVTNYIDTVLSSTDDYVCMFDMYKTYTISNEVNIGIHDIDKYIKNYIQEQIDAHANITPQQKENLAMFSFLSDPEDPVPDPMCFVVPNNVEMRVGDESENNICEITHNEVTLSLMKSYLN